MENGRNWLCFVSDQLLPCRHTGADGTIFFLVS
jgi:hypothetical protein